MPLHVFPLTRFKICLVVYHGIIGQSDFDTLWETLRSASGYEPNFDELVVYAPGSSFERADSDTSKREAQRLIGEAKQQNLRQKKRRAMVSEDMGIRILGEMFIDLVKAEASEKIEISCFASVEEAVIWIARGRTEGNALDDLFSSVSPKVDQAFKELDEELAEFRQRQALPPSR